MGDDFEIGATELRNFISMIYYLHSYTHVLKIDYLHLEYVLKIQSSSILAKAGNVLGEQKHNSGVSWP